VADSLKVQEFVRVRLTRDGTTLYDQSFKNTETAYTEHTTERAVLSTNMATSQAVNLGGVSVAGRLFLETDKSIQIGLGITPANKITLSDQGTFMVVGSFSHIWVRNTGTQEARIAYVVTD
jgi:hypothetical protein